MPKYEKIMLINPSNTLPKDSVRRLTSPMGLMYLGAMLRKKGYDAKIVDSTCEGYFKSRINGEYMTYGLSDEEIVQRVRDYKPNLVGVTSMFSAQQNNAIHHADLVKSVSNEIPIVLGGIHPSIAPESTIRNNSVDYVIMGEGEHRILSLLEGLNAEKKDFDFDGIAYKSRVEIVMHPMQNRIKNLDELPLPARDLIEMEKYIQIGVPFAPFSKEERVEQVMTTRGCPFDCNFCSTVQYWGHSLRTRSVDNILKEFEELKTKYGIKEIQFADDNLTIDKNRAKELFRRMKDFEFSWCTPNGLMIQSLDNEMIDLMAESGAYQVSLAIESGSQRVLKEIVNKRVPEKSIVKGLVDRLHKNKINVHGLLIVGFPGEKRAEIDETFEYPYAVGLDSASFFIAYPMLGSRLYYECKKKGYIDEKNLRWDLKHAEIIIPEDSPDYVMPRRELEILVEEGTRKFNEYQKQNKPDEWDAKFKQFLKRHGDKANLILGRVT